jgi:hypothetical protein
MGHLDDDAAADHARTKRLEMTDALPDQRVERRRLMPVNLICRGRCILERRFQLRPALLVPWPGLHGTLRQWAHNDSATKRQWRHPELPKLSGRYLIELDLAGS